MLLNKVQFLTHRFLPNLLLLKRKAVILDFIQISFNTEKVRVEILLRSLVRTDCYCTNSHEISHLTQKSS
jgi:hypothetical protein